jgi:hypothetical protein
VPNSFIIVLFNLLIKEAKANRERESHIVNTKDIKKRHVEFVCLVSTIQKEYIRVLIQVANTPYISDKEHRNMTSFVTSIFKKHPPSHLLGFQVYDQGL